MQVAAMPYAVNELVLNLLPSPILINSRNYSCIVVVFMISCHVSSYNVGFSITAQSQGVQVAFHIAFQAKKCADAMLSYLVAL